jgi:hypothetical protein
MQYLLSYKQPRTKLQSGIIKLLIVGSDQLFLLFMLEVCFIRIVYSRYGGGVNQLLRLCILTSGLYSYI